MVTVDFTVFRATLAQSALLACRSRRVKVFLLLLRFLLLVMFRWCARGRGSSSQWRWWCRSSVFLSSACTCVKELCIVHDSCLGMYLEQLDNRICKCWRIHYTNHNDLCKCLRPDKAIKPEAKSDSCRTKIYSLVEAFFHSSVYRAKKFLCPLLAVS